MWNPWGGRLISVINHRAFKRWSLRQAASRDGLIVPAPSAPLLYHRSRHERRLPRGVEDASEPLGPLKRLNRPVQRNATLRAWVAVVLVEAFVSGAQLSLSSAEVWRLFLIALATSGTKGYQGQNRWLVGAAAIIGGGRHAAPG